MKKIILQHNFQQAAKSLFALFVFIAFSFNAFSQTTTFNIRLQDASTAATSAGAVDQEIVRVRVSNPNGGGQGTGTITAMNFTPTLDANNTNVTAAKLYYTGTSSTFATGTQLGSDDVDLSNGISFTFSQALPKGSIYYFWLAYDIDAGAANCTEYDATQVQADITTDATIGTYTDEATGKRVLVGAGCWTYCSSNASVTTYSYISNITFNTINNTSSGCANYTDFTGISTTVVKSSSYDLTITTKNIRTRIHDVIYRAIE